MSTVKELVDEALRRFKGYLSLKAAVSSGSVDARKARTRVLESLNELHRAVHHREPNERIFSLTSELRGWNLRGEIRGTFADGGDSDGMSSKLTKPLEVLGFRVEEIK
jgi:hypothetical protein